MLNNQYDSFAFRLYADSGLNIKPSADKLIYMGKKKQSTQKSVDLQVTR